MQAVVVDRQLTADRPAAAAQAAAVRLIQTEQEPLELPTPEVVGAVGQRL